MIIQVDTREKKSQTDRIFEHFENQGVQFFQKKLEVGDYMSLSNKHIVIDRKQSLNEYASNISHDHARLKREIIKANENGIKIIFLIEDDKIQSLEEVEKWFNLNSLIHERYVKPKMLKKAMLTQLEKYDIEFVFCKKNETGYKIVELLEKNGG